MVNGFDTLLITKLDVLDHLEEIPVCVGYRLCGKEVTEMPATYRALEVVRTGVREAAGLANFDSRRDAL